jgi:hypothetical protein
MQYLDYFTVLMAMIGSVGVTCLLLRGATLLMRAKLHGGWADKNQLKFPMSSFEGLYGTDTLALQRRSRMLTAARQHSLPRITQLFLGDLCVRMEPVNRALGCR